VRKTSSLTGFFYSLYCFVLALLFVLIVQHTHNTTQTSMPPAGFEPVIPASDRPQTFALDCSATGNGFNPRFVQSVASRCTDDAIPAHMSPVFTFMHRDSKAYSYRVCFWGQNRKWSPLGIGRGGLPGGGWMIEGENRGPLLVGATGSLAAIHSLKTSSFSLIIVQWATTLSEYVQVGS
jgi:hypothetical protein